VAGSGPPYGPGGPRGAGRRPGTLRRGTELRAEIGWFLTVRDNHILRHETYDCYYPFG
jgi:hypothetical protein